MRTAAVYDPPSAGRRGPPPPPPPMLPRLRGVTADAARPARAPVDVSLVLIDRTGRVDLEAAEAEAREGVETAVDVVRVAAPYEAVGRQEHRLGTLAVPAGAPWASAVLAGVEAARGEAVVVLDVGLLFRFAGAVALGPELLAGEAGAVAARVLRFDRDRIDFDRGTFSSTRYAVSEHRDHLDRSVARRSRPSLYVDGRAFAVRREALLALAPPAPEFDLVFGDDDLGWRLWLAGSSIVTSERVTVRLDERVVVPLGRLPGAMQAAHVQRAGLPLIFQELD